MYWEDKGTNKSSYLEFSDVKFLFFAADCNNKLQSVL